MRMICAGWLASIFIPPPSLSGNARVSFFFSMVLTCFLYPPTCFDIPSAPCCSSFHLVPPAHAQPLSLFLTFSLHPICVFAWVLDARPSDRGLLRHHYLFISTLSALASSQASRGSIRFLLVGFSLIFSPPLSLLPPPIDGSPRYPEDASTARRKVDNPPCCSETRPRFLAPPPPVLVYHSLAIARMHSATIRSDTQTHISSHLLI